MDAADITKCEDCLKCVDEEIDMTCTSSQCDRYYCSDCTTEHALLPPCSEEWACSECCRPQEAGDDNEASDLASGDTQEVSYGKPEVVNLIQDIRRLSRGLMSIKNKLREATLSITHGHERQGALESSKAEAMARIKTLEKRIREIELLRYTVKELRKYLNTQSYNYVLNSIEVSLDTTMKIFCALHIMQQKK